MRATDEYVPGNEFIDLALKYMHKSGVRQRRQRTKKDEDVIREVIISLLVCLADAAYVGHEKAAVIYSPDLKPDRIFADELTRRLNLKVRFSNPVLQALHSDISRRVMGSASLIPGVVLRYNCGAVEVIADKKRWKSDGENISLRTTTVYRLSA